MLPYLLSIYLKVHGIQVDTSFSSKVDTVFPNDTISVIVVDSEIAIRDITFKLKGIADERYSTPTELLASELFRYDYGRVIGSPTYRHKEAV